MGTAGGIFHFRDRILAGGTTDFFVMNGDVCADFPLKDMLDFHNSAITVMATEATRHQSLNYGCLVTDNQTGHILHYVEKPATYVSTLINCGVYLFNKEIFGLLQSVYDVKQPDFLETNK